MSHKNTSHMQKRLNGSKYTRKTKEVKTRELRFWGRTWENLCRAIQALKARYHRTVRLVKQKALGAGLYSGLIQVA